jgi:hypothetical protein
MNLFPFPILAMFGWDDVLYYAVILGIQASATYASYSAQQQTAKQASLNAEAAAQQEAARAAAEREAATRQKLAEQRRFRQTQAAAISGQGIQMTGTPLDILADTEVQNQLELQNIAYSNDLQKLDIQNRRASALSAANAAKPSTGATLLSGASSAVNTYNNTARPTSAKPAETAFTGGTIHTTSQRPY